MKSLTATRLAQRVRRLSRETGYHPDLLSRALARADVLRLSAAELAEALAAARRDQVQPVAAVEALAARRAAGLAAVAGGELGLDLAGGGGLGAVAREGAGEGPALDLGWCDATVSGDAREGGSWRVLLRPRGDVDLGREAVAHAAAGASVQFTLERGSLAERLVRENLCTVGLDPGWLAERAARPEVVDEEDEPHEAGCEVNRG